MPCVYEFWPSADMSVPETQSNQGFANRALPVMYLSTSNSGLSPLPITPKLDKSLKSFCVAQPTQKLG